MAGDVFVHWRCGELRSIFNPDSVKAGYGTSFTRYFDQPQLLRAPEATWVDIRALERESEGLLGEIVGGT